MVLAYPNKDNEINDVICQRCGGDLHDGIGDFQRQWLDDNFVDGVA